MPRLRPCSLPVLKRLSQVLIFAQLQFLQKYLNTFFEDTFYSCSLNYTVNYIVLYLYNIENGFINILILKKIK